jgi:hypothetical protein
MLGGLFNNVFGGSKKEESHPSDAEIMGNISATSLIKPSTKDAYQKKLLQIQKIFFDDKKSLYWIMTNP